MLGIDWKASRVKWRFADPDREFPFLASAAVTDTQVIVAGRDKRLHALDRETGKPTWTFVTKGRIDSSPVVVGRRVFVGSSDGKLYAVDLDTGKETWSFEAGGPISASPTINGMSSAEASSAARAKFGISREIRSPVFRWWPSTLFPLTKVPLPELRSLRCT